MEFVASGGIITLGRQRFIVRQKGDDLILRVPTGFAGEIDLGMIAEIIKECGELSPHGSFDLPSLEGGSENVATDEERDTLDSFVSSPGFATKFAAGVRRGFEGSKIPKGRDDGWLIRDGGGIFTAGMHRDDVCALIWENGQVKKVRVPNGRELFNELEAKRLDKNARARELRLQNNAKAFAEPESKQAPETAPVDTGAPEA